MQEDGCDYIAMLDGDDYWCDSKKLSKQFKCFEDNENCGLVYTNIALNIKTCCLSKNVRFVNDVYLNPLMWSHYVDSHMGICIQYEITKETIERYNDEKQIMRIGSVRHKNHKAMSDYIILDNALLAKGECWSYENEERLIYYCKKGIRRVREESKK